MELTEFEIFLWKYGLNLFSAIMLIVVGVLHYWVVKKRKHYESFLKHLK